MRSLIVFLTLLFSGASAMATGPALGSLLTYEGVLTSSGGTPITTLQNVKFQIILGASCVVFEEMQSITPGSDGEFSVTIGTGTRSDTTTNTRDRVFASSGAVACEGGGTGAASGFGNRSLRIIVGATTLSPDIVLGNVPTALNAEKLADKGPSDFVNVNASSGVTQSNVESIFNRFTKLDDLLNNLNAGSGTFTGNITGNAATATTLSSILPVTLGGTGASTAVGARTNLGLSAIATSGSAADLTTGTVAPARLGTGTADNTTYLRGDGTWATVAAGGGVTSVTAGVGLANSGTATAVILDLANVGTAGTYYKVTTDANGRVTAGVPALATADIPTLDASKISSGVFADNLIPNPSVDKITSPAGKYFTYKPNGVGCAAGEVLKYDLTVNAGNPGWKCAVDDSGTGLTAMNGDVGGWSNTSVVQRINGVNVAPASSPDDQKFLKFVNGSGWQPHYVKLSELRNNTGIGSAFNTGSCTAAQTLVWSSIADQFSCQNIQLGLTQITGSTDLILNGGNAIGGGMVIGQTSADGLTLITSNQSRLAITSSGKFGFNVGTPFYDLDISGPSGASRTVFLSTASDIVAQSSRFLGYKKNGSGGYPAAGHDLVAFGSNRSGVVTETAGMVVMSSEAHTGSAAGSKLDFRVIPSGGFEDSVSAMSIESNGYLSVGKTNVGSLSGPGLVTPAPSQNRVEITGFNTTPSAYSNGTLLFTNNGISEQAGDELGAVIFAHRQGANIRAKISSVVTGSTSNNGGGTILFSTKQDGSTSFSERVRITDTGSVGIGTTNPQATLDVNGHIRLAKLGSAPPCSSANDGAIALTSQYTTCVCKGGSNYWVRTSDGITTCTW